MITAQETKTVMLICQALADIAQKLDVNFYDVAAMVTNTQKRQEIRRELIKNLTEQGLSSHAIAERLQVNYQTIRNDLIVMQKRNGYTPPQRQRSQHCNAIVGQNGNLTDRARQMLLLQNQGLTYQQIGNYFGITWQRASQCFRQMRARNDCYIPDKMDVFYPTQKLLGVSPEHLRQLIESGQIPCRQNIKTRKYHFSASDIEIAKQVVAENKTLTLACSVCNKAYTRKRQGHRKNKPGYQPVCSKACYYKKKYASQSASIQYRGRNLAIHLKLSSVRLGQKEQWVPIGEACTLSGLSPGQLNNLRRVSLIASRQVPRPQKRWLYTNLFSASHCQALREILTQPH